MGDFLSAWRYEAEKFCGLDGERILVLHHVCFDRERAFADLGVAPEADADDPD